MERICNIDFDITGTGYQPDEDCRAALTEAAALVRLGICLGSLPLDREDLRDTIETAFFLELDKKFPSNNLRQHLSICEA